MDEETQEQLRKFETIMRATVIGGVESDEQKVSEDFLAGHEATLAAVRWYLENETAVK